jgi:hypothetical protein
MRDRRDDRARWVRVALAAGAGLGSLAGCSGAIVVIVLLFLYTTDVFVILGSSSPTSPLFWVGLVAALLFAWASLSLPARALGVREDAMKAAALSGLSFCAFVLFCVVSLATSSVGPLQVALAALVGTPVVGSLVAVQEEGRVAIRLARVTLVAAAAIYCVSLLAYWLVPEDDLLGFLAVIVVAVSSWPVLPGIEAMLRSD